tara:strand:- start:1270 stop:1407 length:138 start_codon:yes stop_codon:yes gene_type:complete
MKKNKICETDKNTLSLQPFFDNHELSRINREIEYGNQIEYGDVDL